MGVLSIALLVAFCVVERIVSEPVIPLDLFKIQTFSAASVVSFVIGFVMFGAIIFMPLFLQVVQGSSPTKSGLQLLPMIAGLLTTFIISGRLVSKTGKYKRYPIMGTAVTTVGLGMLTQLQPTTSYAYVAASMFVVGLGLGLVMQVLVVAVQNSVPHARLGTATSTATFFRTVGGAFGVAALGAVFNTHLASSLRIAAEKSATIRQLLKEAAILNSPSQIQRLAPPERHTVIVGFSHALHSVYLVAVPFAIVAFLGCWLLKEAPLRTTAHVAPLGRHDAEATGSNGAGVERAPRRGRRRRAPLAVTARGPWP